jgi:hypothetical protein
MDRLVAPLVVQLRRELLPLSMVAGRVVKLLIVGGPLTVTVAVAVTDPAELVAVNV